MMERGLYGNWGDSEPRNLTTWRELLEDYLEYIKNNFEGAYIGTEQGKWSGIYVKVAIKQYEDEAFQALLDKKFDNSHGSYEGFPFQIYTEDFIFLSHTYDNLESVVAIPRHPEMFLDTEIQHVSGGCEKWALKLISEGGVKK